MLSNEHIDEYMRNGVVVIENILTSDEVEQARHNFHQQLLSLSIDHDKIL